MKNVKLYLLLNRVKDFDDFKSIIWRKTYFAESVRDFKENKERVKIFGMFSHPLALIFFGNVKLRKSSDEVYTLKGKKPEYDKLVKIYEIIDDTGIEKAVWQTTNEPPLTRTSCEDFERMKSFNGDVVSGLSMLFNLRTNDKYVLGINYYNNSQRRNPRDLLLEHKLQQSF